MAKLYNLARMTVASTGTGTITLGAAATVNGVLYLNFAAAGLADGETFSYAIADVGGSEIGTSVYTAAGTTMTRVVTKSTNSNTAINMTAAAQVFITPRAEDLNDASIITSGTFAAARLPGGVMPTMTLPFHANAAGAITWTAMPLAATNLNGTSRTITKADLTNYSQGRLIVNMQGTAGAAAAVLELKYQTSNNYTVGNFLTSGSSAIQCAINVTNQIVDSGWINLVAGAKADVYWDIVGSGGDGATNPVMGDIVAHFR